MGFWSLLEVASMPILQVLLISALGALMATDYCNLLGTEARRSLNKVVFMVFTPSLMFASLVKTVTLQDIISWWFMPINIGITFLVGTILGWMVVKMLKPKSHLEGLIIAMCSSGNLGNLPLIIVPAICDEEGSPFGDRSACRSVGLSYASFSMALGGFFIWTHSYSLIQNSAKKFRALQAADASSKSPNGDLEADEKAHLLQGEDQVYVPIAGSPSKSALKNCESKATTSRDSIGELKRGKASFWKKLAGTLHKLVEELLSPPTVAAIIGFIFGATTWLRRLLIGEGAPLRLIQDTLKLLGDGTIPCITLILGGNLTQGLRSSKVKTPVIVGVVCVRYLILPAAGIGVVKAASALGFLSPDPLYHYVLMLHFTLPPAMNIGTMTQLFNVGQEECSVLFLWTYLVAVLALTVWPTVFLWILS